MDPINLFVLFLKSFLKSLNPFNSTCTINRHSMLYNSRQIETICANKICEKFILVFNYDGGNILEEKVNSKNKSCGPESGK